MTLFDPGVQPNPAHLESLNPHQPEQTRSLTKMLCVPLIALLLLFTHSLSAQTTYGTILGNVTDPTGASVPSANVTLINVDTQERHAAISSNSGDYQFPNLIPGKYEVDFERSGFATVKRQGIVITVQASVRVDAKLQIGDVNQTVSIDTTLPLLETQPGSLGQLIEGKQVQEMPLNGRNVFNLLVLAPGVVPQGSTGGNPTLDVATLLLACFSPTVEI